MDQYIQNSIDIRRKAIFDYYEIKNKNILKEIEDLFQEINLMGENSTDVSNFESQFIDSELNEKYMNLIQRIAVKCPLKKEHKAVVYTKEECKEDIKENVKEELQYLGSEAYLDTKSVINRKLGITDKIRRAPIVGTAWEIEHQTGVITNLKDTLLNKRKSKQRAKEEEKNLDKEQ